MLRRIQWPSLMLALCAACMARAASPEKTAEDFVHIATVDGPSAAIVLYHPSDVQRVYDKVLLRVEREAESKRKQIRTALFGAGASLDDVRHMTPENLLLAVIARVPTAHATTYDQYKALGVVKEGEVMHVVVRASLEKVERLKRRTIVQVVTLLPSGKEWRAAVPSPIESFIDDVLAAAPDTLPDVVDAPAAAVAKNPEWDALLARGSDLLQRGSCLTYFIDVVEPSFAKSMTQKSFDAIVKQCELNERTREKFRLGLELAAARAPRVESGGTRVIYDLHGEGLPYEQLVLTRVENRWYVASE